MPVQLLSLGGSKESNYSGMIDFFFSLQKYCDRYLSYFARKLSSFKSKAEKMLELGISVVCGSEDRHLLFVGICAKLPGRFNKHLIQKKFLSKASWEIV